MKASGPNSRVLLCTMIIAASLITASWAAIADEAKWLGTYEQQNNDKMVLVIKADHKGTMAPAGQAGEMTWEIAGDDKIIVHMGADATFMRTSDGNLRDEEGTVWKKTK